MSGRAPRASSGALVSLPAIEDLRRDLLDEINRDWEAHGDRPISPDDDALIQLHDGSHRRNPYDMSDDEVLDATCETRDAGRRPVALAAAEPVLTTLADVAPEDVSWLWHGRIPFGKLTILEGMPGVGKSHLTIELAARITAGRALPGEAPRLPAHVLLLGVEDALADTVRPRLDAAGGDAAMFEVFTGVACNGEAPRLPTFPTDALVLRAAIREIGAELVIVDPLTTFIGSDLNTFKDADVRRALTPLAQLAEETGAAIVAVRHLTKQSTGQAITAGAGSIAFAGVARTVLLAAKDPEDAGRGVLAAVKANLAKMPSSLTYRLEDTPNGRARVVWGGTSAHSADDLIAAARDDGERGALDEAKDMLREWLTGGALAKAEVLRRARDARISERTIERAKQALGVVHRRDGNGEGSRMMWALPYILGELASRGENGTKPVAAASPSYSPTCLASSPSSPVVASSVRHPCPGGCGVTFSAPVRSPCATCRDRLALAG